MRRNTFDNLPDIYDDEAGSDDFDVDDNVLQL